MKFIIPIFWGIFVEDGGVGGIGRHAVRFEVGSLAVVL